MAHSDNSQSSLMQRSRSDIVATVVRYAPKQPVALPPDRQTQILSLAQHHGPLDHVSSQAQTIRIKQLEASVADLQRQLEFRTQEIAILTSMASTANQPPQTPVSAQAPIHDKSVDTSNSGRLLSEANPPASESNTSVAPDHSAEKIKSLEADLSETLGRLHTSENLVSRLQEELAHARQHAASASKSPKSDHEHHAAISREKDLADTQLMAESLRQQNQILLDRETALIQDLTTAHEIIDKQHEKIESMLEQTQQLQKLKQEAASSKPPTKKINSANRTNRSQLKSDSDMNLQQISASIESSSTLSGDLKALLRNLMDEHRHVLVQMSATKQRLDQQVDVNREIKRLIVQSSIGPQLYTHDGSTTQNHKSRTLSQPTTSFWFSGTRNTPLVADQDESLLQKYNDALITIADLQEQFARAELDPDLSPHDNDTINQQ